MTDATNGRGGEDPAAHPEPVDVKAAVELADALCYEMLATYPRIIERLREGARDLHPYAVGDVDKPHIACALPAYLNEAADLIDRLQADNERMVKLLSGETTAVLRRVEP